MYNYIVIVVILISFIFMIAKASKFYSYRYEVIFITLFVGFILDLATVRSQSIYDISTLIWLHVYDHILSYI